MCSITIDKWKTAQKSNWIPKSGITNRKRVNLMRKPSIIHIRNRRLIFSEAFLQSGRMSEKYFTRKRKLPFHTVISILLNFLTRSLQIELDDFKDYVMEGTGMENITKQAFSKARQKINPGIFEALANDAVIGFYEDGEYNRFNEYRLCAIDGTTIELPNFDHLREHFGDVGDEKETVRARASALFDIENDIIITAEIDSYRTDERTLALRHLDKLKALGLEKNLVLFDRGYPSKELIARLYDLEIAFVMRTKDNFLSTWKGKNENDSIRTFEYDGQKYSLRLLRIVLPSGDIETLATSIMDQAVDEAAFLELYAKRWGIESNYNTLKNKLQIENFSGYTAISIVQDFFATIYLRNMAAAFKYEAEKEIYNNTILKYTYRINENVLIGKLKHRLVKALLSGNPGMAAAMIDTLIKQFEKNLVPIRPNRSNPRNMNSCGIKYPPNQKSAL